MAAAVMMAAAVIATTTTPEASARISRNNVNVCDDCQSNQNSGDNSQNTASVTNGGVFQTR